MAKHPDEVRNQPISSEFPFRGRNQTRAHEILHPKGLLVEDLTKETAFTE
jgi:hypothetical protein